MFKHVHFTFLFSNKFLMFIHYFSVFKQALNVYPLIPKKNPKKKICEMILIESNKKEKK